jgi:Fibrobacter succinogenes major domain (Fib_succ_major).
VCLASPRLFDRFVQAAFWGIDNQYCMHTIGFNPKESGYENAGEFYRSANSIRCLRDEPYTGSLVSDEKSTSTHKPPSIEYYLNKDKTYGEFSDKRDGKVYKTIEIDGQTWMAQNLNYKTPDGRSVCIQDDEKICEVFGRQYTWSVAVDSAGNNLSHYKKIDHFPWQGICPDGWHIPSLR